MVRPRGIVTPRGNVRPCGSVAHSVWQPTPLARGGQADCTACHDEALPLEAEAFAAGGGAGAAFKLLMPFLGRLGGIGGRR